ncbi:hypothetical protein D3Z45_22415, partial [Lachnospiraceae bacterium]|nr:hypothetical protein [Lachnospiraceae bacterium]
FEGAILFEIDYTPKGTKEMKTVKVWAKNRLDASNYMILNHIWGKQHVDLCQYFGQKKSKDYAAFFSSSSSFC